jgi:deoxyribose-phosphate aldolase
MNLGETARRIDHMLLEAAAGRADVERVCGEAKRFSLHGVCVAPSRVVLASHCLEDTEIKVITVVGFPFGFSEADAKRFETEAAIDAGAQEIEVVPNMGWLKDGQSRHVLRELRDVVEAADQHPVKVIVETEVLTREEIAQLCRLAIEAEAEFVAASAMLGSRQVSGPDVELIREAVGQDFGIKVIGDIADLERVEELLKGGVNRMGLSTLGKIFGARVV